MTRGLFIAGTDTGVGKTFVTAGIASVCRQRGLRVGVYKPVASGCDPQAPHEHDAWILWYAAGQPLELAAVCPQSFVAPLAPHLAAEAEGRAVDEARLLSGLDVWREFDLVLVEGVGGLMSPLSRRRYVIDLAVEIGWPLVVVSANRLGTINHTLQTLCVASTYAPGLPVAGLVLNDVGRDDSSRTNAAELRSRCAPPLLASVAAGNWHALQDVDWYELARAGRNE